MEGGYSGKIASATRLLVERDGMVRLVPEVPKEVER
jgi:hypothetical protein